MADTKISALTELATTPATDDELAIVDTDASATKRISVSNLLAAAPAGDITTVTAGTLLTGGGTSGAVTLDVDLSTATTSTNDADGDFFLVTDASNAQRKLTKANIALSGFNNDSGFTTNAGDITQVDAGTNLSGGASSGVATVNLAIDSEVNFADNLATRPKLKDYSEHTNALGNTTATATIDLESGNVITATLAVATTTFVFSNPIASDDASSFTLILAQDGTGSRIVTWPATVKWAGGSAPTLTTATTGIDVFAFTTIDLSLIHI